MTIYSQGPTDHLANKTAQYTGHQRVCRGFGFAILALVATSAFGQAAGPAAPVASEGSAQLQEVVVTGSRIATPNMTSSSPIQVLSSQEIKLEGTTDIAALLYNVPQNFQNSQSDLGPQQNPLTSAGGISTADLRGLGPQRTLVLVDGRRLGVGDASTLNPNPAPDLNQIPAQLVERIDVVTGGASAVYGSDAIAGVVNFIMKRDYQGIEIDGQVGANSHQNHEQWMQSLVTQSGSSAPSGNEWDGQNRSLSVIMGTAFGEDKGNIEVYFTYRDADPVSQGSRDFSGCKLDAVPSTNPNVITTPICVGSPNSNIVIPINSPLATCPYGDCFTVLGRQLLPWPQAGTSPPSPYFNSSPYQTLSAQDTRYMGGFFAHYDVNDYVKPYVDFSYMNDTANSKIAPGAAFLGGNAFDPTGSGGFLVNCGPVGSPSYNPLLSAQQNSVLCNPANAPQVYSTTGGLTAVDTYIGRRNIEAGPRTTQYEHNNYRAVFGFSGSAFDAWTYDAYGSYYYTSLYQAVNGYLSSTKTQNALLVTQGANGPQCAGQQAGCIPWNLWTQGGVTPAQAQSLAASGTSQGTITERIVDVNTTGQLGKYGLQSPLASDGVAVNLGAEHRSDVLNYNPDYESTANDLNGFGGAGVAVNNGYHVQEEFIEIRAPIAENQSWANELTAGGAYRFSNYSTVGHISTYKFDLQYAPIHDLLIRGSFDRAIRAPNIIELYTPDSVTNTSVVAADPCAGPTPIASPANCMHTGVSASQYGHIAQCPAGQCATLTGGNPDLAQETANTISYGFTYSPSYLSGFSGSLDYYKIILKNEVGVVPLSTAFNTCLSSGNPLYCNSIVRTSAGALFGTTIAGGGYIKGTNVNIATAQVSGIDVQLAYRWDIGKFGKMSATMSGTWLQHQTSQPLPTASTYDCAGLYGPTCQTVNPRWRSITRISWQTPVDLLVSMQWRYIGSVNLDNNTGNPELVTTAYGPGVYDQFDARIPNYSYFDLSAIYDVNKHLSFRAGVNNLFDKDPPIISATLTQTGSPNSYPTYDSLGRVLFAAFTAKF
jgi:iron complex outermembrane receptor protein